VIPKNEIDATQASWGRSLVEVGAASSWSEAHTRATALVQDHYLITEDSLLFCPTKVTDQQFRRTLEDAVSYFVGRSAAHPEDKGFALEPWRRVRFENAGLVQRGEVVMAMGNYYFERADGTEVKVEYSFVYVRDAEGNIKIQLHHSALPFGS
jgi:hypothetical protein